MGVVVGEVGDFDVEGMDGADLVTMVDDLSAAGDEDVVVVDEEGAEG